MARTTTSTRIPRLRTVQCACVAIATTAVVLPLTACVGGDSPRSSFYRARSVGVAAQPGNGAEITVVTRAPIGTVQETGVVARRFD